MLRILKADGRINELDEQSLSPLMWAAVYGQTDVVRLLVQAGASTEICNDEGVTALMMACYYGSHGVIKVLVDSGLDIDQVDMVRMQTYNSVMVVRLTVALCYPYELAMWSVGGLSLVTNSTLI